MRENITKKKREKNGAYVYNNPIKNSYTNYSMSSVTLIIEK